MESLWKQLQIKDLKRKTYCLHRVLEVTNDQFRND